MSNRAPSGNSIVKVPALRASSSKRVSKSPYRFRSGSVSSPPRGPGRPSVESVAHVSPFRPCCTTSALPTGPSLLNVALRPPQPSFHSPGLPPALIPQQYPSLHRRRVTPRTSQPQGCCPSTAVPDEGAHRRDVLVGSMSPPYNARAPYPGLQRGGGERGDHAIHHRGGDAGGADASPSADLRTLGRAVSVDVAVGGDSTMLPIDVDPAVEEKKKEEDREKKKAQLLEQLYAKRAAEVATTTVGLQTDPPDTHDAGEGTGVGRGGRAGQAIDGADCGCPSPLGLPRGAGARGGVLDQDLRAHRELVAAISASAAARAEDALARTRANRLAIAQHLSTLGGGKVCGHDHSCDPDHLDDDGECSLTSSAAPPGHAAARAMRVIDEIDAADTAAGVAALVRGLAAPDPYVCGYVECGAEEGMPKERTEAEAVAAKLLWAAAIKGSEGERGAVDGRRGSGARRDVMQASTIGRKGAGASGGGGERSAAEYGRADGFSPRRSYGAPIGAGSRSFLDAPATPRAGGALASPRSSVVGSGAFSGYLGQHLRRSIPAASTQAASMY